MFLSDITKSVKDGGLNRGKHSLLLETGKSVPLHKFRMIAALTSRANFHIGTNLQQRFLEGLKSLPHSEKEKTALRLNMLTRMLDVQDLQVQ